MISPEGADKRVKLKLHYFRDRSDLVLPVIEDRYIVHDSKRDCFVLDLSLLQNESVCSASKSARTPRSKHVTSKSDEEMTLLPEDSEKKSNRSHHPEEFLSMPSSQLGAYSSRWDSQRSRSQRSVETAEQRSLRLIRAAKIRDERISIAQQNVRSAELEWRLSHLQTCQEKSRRKRVATAQRILFSWIVIARVTQRWQEALLKAKWLRAARSHHFGDHYANRSRAHWQRAKNLVHKSLLESGKNMRDFRKASWFQLSNRFCMF